MPALITIIAAVGLMYFFVLGELESNPTSKKKNSPPINWLNPIMMLALFVLPIGLTYLVVWWNARFDIEPAVSAQLHWLVFRFQTIFYILWIGCGILAALFYFYVLFKRRGWIYILGIPFQLGVFLLAWMIGVSHISFYDAISIDDKTYHMFQLNGLAWGKMYLLDCDDVVCDAEEIAFVDSWQYYGGSIEYDASTHSLYIEADLDYKIEEYVIPIADN